MERGGCTGAPHHTRVRQALGRAQVWCGHPVWPPTLPFGLLKASDLKTSGGSSLFPKTTFPNTFAIVLSLICVIWMQLTRTNAVFSRIALMSCFCAESQSSRKIPEKIQKVLFFQKTHGARRWSKEGAQGHHTHPGRGWPLAAPRGGVATLCGPRRSPLDYLKPLT